MKRIDFCKLAFVGVILAGLCLCPFMSSSAESDSSGTSRIINWQDLALALPDGLDGFDAGDPDGGIFNLDEDDTTSGAAHLYATAQRYFTQGIDEDNMAEIDISIMDAGVNTELLAPYLHPVEFDSANGSLRRITVADHDGMQVISEDADDRVSEELYIVIESRLLVSVRGNEATTSDQLIQAASAVDFDMLDMLLSRAAATQ